MNDGLMEALASRGPSLIGSFCMNPFTLDWLLRSGHVDASFLVLSRGYVYVLHRLGEGEVVYAGTSSFASDTILYNYIPNYWNTRKKVRRGLT